MVRKSSQFVALLGLLLALGTAHAAAPEAQKKSGSQADIDAFLDKLQQTSEAPPPQPAETGAEPAAAAPPQPTPPAAGPASAPPTVGSITPQLNAETLRASARARSNGDDMGPVQTLLLILGGIAICALATVGLTLAFLALRKDMRNRRRARQRRFIPYPPKKTKPAGPH